MKNWIAFACGSIALALAGCQTGVGVVSYDRSTTPVVAEATQDGEYALFASGTMDPKVSYYLKQGEPLGFKSGKTGEIIAVAGKNEISEPDGSYVWRRRGPNDQNNGLFGSTSTTQPAR